MSDPRDPFDNPPGWTDPYADLADISPNDPVPPLEDPGTPPATPPGSPLLTGLVVGLLLVALSVAVFQLLKGDDTGDAGGDTSTSVPADGSTTLAPGETTTSTTTTAPVPESEPYPPLGSPVAVDKMKLKSDRVHIQVNDVLDLAFGDPANISIGRLVSSFGEPDEDTKWQISTGEWGVCTGELERVVRFGPFAAIVTTDGTTEVFNGYRQDISFTGLDSDAMELETLSGLKAGDSIERLEKIYATEEVTFSDHPLVGQTFELRGSDSGQLLLWGPVTGTEPENKVVGIYSPDVCNRP
ncbi:MAG: hypothetical protein ABFS21_06490 [Actinomycetota bacterium]